MRFKDDNDNRYRVNFTRATEAHIDKMTVAEFIEYLENNAEFEDESTPIYIDGKTIWCKDCVLVVELMQRLSDESLRTKKKER